MIELKLPPSDKTVNVLLKTDKSYMSNNNIHKYITHTIDELVSKNFLRYSYSLNEINIKAVLSYLKEAISVAKALYRGECTYCKGTLAKELAPYVGDKFLDFMILVYAKLLLDMHDYDVYKATSYVSTLTNMGHNLIIMRGEDLLKLSEDDKKDLSSTYENSDIMSIEDLIDDTLCILSGQYAKLEAREDLSYTYDFNELETMYSDIIFSTHVIFDILYKMYGSLPSRYVFGTVNLINEHTLSTGYTLDLRYLTTNCNDIMDTFLKYNDDAKDKYFLEYNIINDEASIFSKAVNTMISFKSLVNDSRELLNKVIKVTRDRMTESVYDDYDDDGDIISIIGEL